MREKRRLDRLPRGSFALQEFGDVCWQEHGVSRKDLAPPQQHECLCLGVHLRMSMPGDISCVYNVSPLALLALDRSPKGSALCLHSWIWVHGANGLSGPRTQPSDSGSALLIQPDAAKYHQ